MRDKIFITLSLQHSLFLLANRWLIHKLSVCGNGLTFEHFQWMWLYWHKAPVPNIRTMSRNASFITWSIYIRGMQPVTKYQDRTVVTPQVSPSITQINHQKNNIMFWDMHATYSFQYLLSVFVLQKGEIKHAMLLFLFSCVFSFLPLGANFCFSLSACCKIIRLGHHLHFPWCLLPMSGCKWLPRARDDRASLASLQDVPHVSFKGMKCDTLAEFFIPKYIRKSVSAGVNGSGAFCSKAYASSVARCLNWAVI